MKTVVGEQKNRNWRVVHRDTLGHRIRIDSVIVSTNLRSFPGEERNKDELDRVMGENGGQAWHIHMDSEGALGM